MPRLFLNFETGTDAFFLSLNRQATKNDEPESRATCRFHCEGEEVAETLRKSERGHR